MIQEKKKHRKSKKKPSAMSQVHNRVNAGVMDGVVYGGMMEAAEPEDEEYEIGMEEGGPEPYAHVVNENTDYIPSLHLSCNDFDAIPFICFKKKDGDSTKVFVGSRSELHSTMPAALFSNGELNRSDFGNSLWDVKRDEKRSGRLWLPDDYQDYSVISFYSYYDTPTQIYGQCWDVLPTLQYELDDTFSTGKIIVDLWTHAKGRADVLMPLRWFNNGTAEVYLPYVQSCVPEKSSLTDEVVFKLETTKGRFALDWYGDDVADGAGFGMNENKKTMYITEEQLKQIKVLSEEKGESVDYNKYIKSLIDFMREQHLNIDPLPKIELNPEEQDGIFVKTGYYSPDERKVVVFTDGRHPKDVLRTVAHEFIHHMQNLQNPDKDWGTGGDLEADSKLRSIEGEAFLLGNIIFREWTEKMKRTTLNESANEMQAFHGSPNNFDEFDELHVGEGAGAQLWGWGTYVTTDRKTGEKYCRSREANGQAYLYEVEIPDDNGRNYLNLDGNPPEVYKTVYKILKKEFPKAKRFLKDGIQTAMQQNTFRWFFHNRPGLMAEDLSKTLDKYGIVGIKYQNGEGLNYLVFRANNVRIVSKTEYNGAVNEITELVEPDDVDLSSFNIKKHLNPKFWDDGHLDTRIRLKLLDIADDFFDSLGVDWVEPEDVIITGSLANYNWNKKYSDIDLHILVDYEDVDERVDFVREYFTMKKNEWNEKHKNLRIFGFPVEVYVQDANEPHASSGVYSIDRDEWITEPDMGKIRSGKVDKKHVREMVSTYMNKIDCLIDIYKSHKDDEYEMRKVAEDATEMFDEIKKLRKDDLAKYGREMCDGNIIFKALRRSDYIGKLITLKNLTYDKINSM